MSITAIVEALVAAGASPRVILEAVRAAEGEAEEVCSDPHHDPGPPGAASLNEERKRKRSARNRRYYERKRAAGESGDEKR